MDEKLFGCREELRLDAVRGRAEREEGFGEQEDEFLPAVQGWDIIIRKEREGDDGIGWGRFYCYVRARLFAD